MTTTNLYSGYDPSGKPSSRVLNPPGGRTSNIFGMEEQPKPQVQEQDVQPDVDQNQNFGATSQPDQQKQQQSESSKRKDSGEAPFASFEESGKPSNPTQFDKCDSGSQNEADFRCYSVTAYREAVQQNAAVRQKARGQASSGFNPITHEEVNSKDSQQTRQHPQQGMQQNNHVQKRTGKLQQQNKGKVSYNPITGEEYPEDYGQKKKTEGKGGEEESDNNKNAESKTEENTSSNAKATDVPEQQQEGKTPKKPAIKVRQPPGGASSGLW